jgi:transposase
MIHELHEEGLSIRAIARKLGIDRKTVQRALRSKTQKSSKRNINIESKLDPYKEYIKSFISKCSERIPYSVLLEDITNMGYRGKRSILQDFLSREYKERKVDNDPIVRFETAAGVQMQIDWATMRSGSNPIYAFIAILGFSRYAFVCFVNNMETETLIACLEKAFLFFGGVTRTLLFDNMKQVIFKRDAYGKGKHQFQPMLLDFAKACSFEVRLCRPYRAKTKGKVERLVSYVKGNFYRPLIIKLKEANLEISHCTLNDYIFRWLTKANNRVHGTLKRIPSQVFKEEESSCLIPYVVREAPQSPQARKWKYLLLLCKNLTLNNMNNYWSAYNE